MHVIACTIVDSRAHLESSRLRLAADITGHWLDGGNAHRGGILAIMADADRDNLAVIVFLLGLGLGLGHCTLEIFRFRDVSRWFSGFLCFSGFG
jgi:hypothetical protein